MTTKQYLEQKNLNERNAFCKKIHNWLCRYTDSVIRCVLAKMDIIVNDEMALKLIDELYSRETKESSDEMDLLMYMMETNDNMRDFHNHPVTHSNSYRDILYDLYIRVDF